MTNAVVEPARSPLFLVRDRRILLWLTCTAVCWRWLLAVRTPLPSVDAVMHLWAAQQLRAGELGHLAWNAVWHLLMAIGPWCGADPIEAAQVAGAIAGGLALVPLACAAQRLRAGAGVPAALLLFTAPWLAAGDAAGSGDGFHLGLLAAATYCVLSARATVATVFGLLLINSAFYLPSGLGYLGAGLALAVGLSHLNLRLRDLLLAALVGGMFYTSWLEVEPRSAVVERTLGEFLADRMLPGQRAIGDVPRVVFHAGDEPWSASRSQSMTVVAWGEALAATDVGAAVFTKATAAAVREILAGDFATVQISPAIDDAARVRGIVVFVRRG